MKPSFDQSQASILAAREKLHSIAATVGMIAAAIEAQGEDPADAVAVLAGVGALAMSAVESLETALQLVAFEAIRSLDAA